MTADSGALLGIHHAALICSDYARSKTSTCASSACACWPRNTARDSWKLDLALPDGGQLELFSFPAAARPSRPEAQGPAPPRVPRHAGTFIQRLSAHGVVNANRSAWTSTPAAASPSSPTPTTCRWSCTKPVDVPGSIPFPTEKDLTSPPETSSTHGMDLCRPRSTPTNRTSTGRSPETVEGGALWVWV